MKRKIKSDLPVGLNESQVLNSRRVHGPNVINTKSESFSALAKDLVRDPMLWLLVIAGMIYFATGNKGDAFFMAVALIIMVSISLYQDRRSQKALNELRALTQPDCRVIRNGNIETIRTADVVMGDYLIAEEGSIIAADAIILQSHDFAVNESVVTGESMPLEKTADSENKLVYQGTVVVRGLSICEVTAIGDNTTFGKIGHSLAAIKESRTPLQQQISVFVKRMAIIGAAFFTAIWIINLYRGNSLLDSLLKALSLAMSIVPEEIPVAFVTFMAVGAWRLSKLGIVVKNTSTIETLGSATVICTDKTGTITQNKMELKDIYVYGTHTITSVGRSDPGIVELISYAMWASEPLPFDPMEVALHQNYQKLVEDDERKNYQMIHEYPLTGHPPFMTHVFGSQQGVRVIAAKGAPESILAACKLKGSEAEKINTIVKRLSSSGARVLGVAKGNWTAHDFPISQNEIDFTFVGLVSFYDPPKENMKEVIADFYKAGIAVKMITGDYPETAAFIARDIGLVGNRILTGEQVMGLTDENLLREVEDVNIFARSFPEAKLKILQALKQNGHIVAMTGDGINDAPALKAAHIGIAMGKRGTEVAKQSSAIVLSDDNLARMVYAVGAGRKIYTNLKNAIQYIISIHIPIILIVFVPLALNWKFTSLLSPLHIIFLEFIMGPTCSIAYENEPFKKDLMLQPPRSMTSGFFRWTELTTSILQGHVIAAGALSTYQYSIINEFSEEMTRSMVLVMLIASNILLTLVNRSFTKPTWVTVGYRNKLIPFIIGITLGLTAMMLFIDPVARFFEITRPSFSHMMVACTIALVSTTWIDIVKVVKRNHSISATAMLIITISLGNVSAQEKEATIQTILKEGSYTSSVHEFYKENNYALAWKTTESIQQLMLAVQTSSIEGLDPNDYHFHELLVRDKNEKVLDIILTESFLKLAHDLHQGKTDPEKLFPGTWEACTVPSDYSMLLSEALSNNKVYEALDQLKPSDNGYEALKYMLSTFRMIEKKGSLPVIAPGNDVHLQHFDERIADIRKMLATLKLIPEELENGSTFYDSTLFLFTTRFQELHGIRDDGIIGPQTQAAMRMTARDYILKILANLEKYRWYQSRLMQRSIQINIPTYDLKVCENERTELRMRAIIGRKDRPTPVISGSITAMIVNPTWTVPSTVLK